MALSGGDMPVARAALDEVRALPKGILSQRLSAVYSATEEDLASHLAAPLLAVLGSSDNVVSLARSRAFFSRVPEGTIARDKLVMKTSGQDLVLRTKDDSK